MLIIISSYFNVQSPGLRHYPPGGFLFDDVYRPNKYSSTLTEKEKYTIFAYRVRDDGAVLGVFGYLPLTEKAWLFQMCISEEYPHVTLVKDCLRMAQEFDKMGIKIYAGSPPELSRFYRLLGFKPVAIKENGSIGWRYG